MRRAPRTNGRGRDRERDHRRRLGRGHRSRRSSGVRQVVRRRRDREDSHGATRGTAMRRCRGDRGQVGGVEALPFGVLVFVVGVLLVVNLWAIVDAKVAATSAAREAARAYVEAADGAEAEGDAIAAARSHRSSRTIDRSHRRRNRRRQLQSLRHGHVRGRVCRADVDPAVRRRVRRRRSRSERAMARSSIRTATDRKARPPVSEPSRGRGRRHGRERGSVLALGAGRAARVGAVGGDCRRLERRIPGQTGARCGRRRGSQRRGDLRARRGAVSGDR